MAQREMLTTQDTAQPGPGMSNEKPDHVKAIEAQEAKKQAALERMHKRADEAELIEASDTAAEIAGGLEDNTKFRAAQRSVERLRALIERGENDPDIISKTYNHARDTFNALDEPELPEDDQAVLYEAMEEMDSILGHGHLREQVMDKAAA